MILIIGGAFQGKLEYAVSKFSLSEEDIADGSLCSLKDMPEAKCLNNFHIFAGRLADAGISPDYFAENNCYGIIISDEIGGGITPADAESRKLREITGRLLCRMAEKADTVIRIHCGIPTAIKGKLP